MPLAQGKSQKSFNHNVKVEMQSGKSQPQSLAIAYAVKRRMGKKMADGGEVTPVSMPAESAEEKKRREAQESMDNRAADAIVANGGKWMSSGGMVTKPPQHLDAVDQEHEDIWSTPDQPDNDDESMADAMGVKHPYREPEPKVEQSGFLQKGGIVEKIMAKRMSAGGEVLNEDRGEDEHGDDFLTDEMPATDWGGKDVEGEHESNPKLARSKMLSGIMDQLHKRHYGR